MSMEMPAAPKKEPSRIAQGESILHEGKSFILELPRHIDEQMHSLAHEVAAELHKEGRGVPAEVAGDSFSRIVQEELQRLREQN